MCTNQFAIFIIGAGGFGGKRSSPHVKVLFVPHSQTASPISKAAFPNPHSQILIPKDSFPKPHFQTNVPNLQGSILRINSKHLISELHSQFSELHFPTASSFLVLPFTAGCMQVATLFFYSQQCVSLTEGLMPLCSTRLSPPRQPSIVSTVTTILSILMQTSPN